MDKDEIELLKNYILQDNDASSAAFGYKFQADAGIFLFCRFYSDIKSIIVESQIQDIEIEKKDGNKILAQVKASQDPYNESNSSKKLNDAISSLIWHRVNDNDHLLYVCNFPNPLGTEMKSYFDNNEIAYPKMSKDAREYIDTCIENIKNKLCDIINSESDKYSYKIKEKARVCLAKVLSQDVKNISILSIPKYREDTKEGITDEISSFLSNTLGFNSSAFISSIVCRLSYILFDLFFVDETTSSKRKMKITKDDFCWSIILSTNFYSKATDADFLKKMGYSTDDLYHIQRYFEDQFHDTDFEFVNKVINAFNDFEYDCNNSDDVTTQFVKAENTYSIFGEYFIYIEDIKLRKGLMMFTIYSLLSDRQLLNRITKGRSI